MTDSPVVSDSPAASPPVTLSLVTYNGRRWLDGCLASIGAQRFADFELLVLDNASTDGSLEMLRQQAADEPRMSLTESPENLGFAAANNRNIRVARGEFVMLLNQDIQLDEAFLGAAVAAFEGRPRVAAVQGRLRRLGPDGQRTEVIDSTGLEMHRDRRVVARRQGELEAQRDLIGGPVWGVDGPAPLYRRSALLDAREPKIGGGWEVLDEEFFMYKEDVDLAWRLRRLGWTTWYEPRALAWHARGAGVGPNRSLVDVARSNRAIPRWIKALSWQNQRLMQIKNERPADVLHDLPWLARRELLSALFIAVADPLRLGSLRGLLRGLPAAARKHRFTVRRTTP